MCGLTFENARDLASYADIKMVSECRWSWLSLMLLTLSCAVKQFREDGHVSWQMGFMVLVRNLAFRSFSPDALTN